MKIDVGAGEKRHEAIEETDDAEIIHGWRGRDRKVAIAGIKIPPPDEARQGKKVKGALLWTPG